jgi:hypothetical protein
MTTLEFKLFFYRYNFSNDVIALVAIYKNEYTGTMQTEVHMEIKISDTVSVKNRFYFADERTIDFITNANKADMCNFMYGVAQDYIVGELYCAFESTFRERSIYVPIALTELDKERILSFFLLGEHKELFSEISKNSNYQALKDLINRLDNLPKIVTRSK